MRFIFSHPDEPLILRAMIAYAQTRIPCDIDPAMASGIAVVCEHGKAVMIYTDHRPGQSVSMNVAGEGHWISRTAFDVFMAYPFRDLAVRRITGLIDKSNKRSRRLAEWIGFRQEGCLRRASRDGRDVIVYGLLPDEYRWAEDMRHERQSTAA